VSWGSRSFVLVLTQKLLSLQGEEEKVLSCLKDEKRGEGEPESGLKIHLL